MPVYCSFECSYIGAVCDFCKHYDFNGDKNGAYTGDGWCKLHQIQKDPENGCDNDFHCTSADKEKVNEQI
jgi:hypothetical protein